jgi:predicted sugar kinase
MSAFQLTGKLDDCHMQIKVKTVSRLHFGVIDYIESTDSFKGSLGVALEWPNTVLTVNKNSDLLIKNGNRKTILELVKKFSKRYLIEPNVILKVEETIPEHSGICNLKSGGNYTRALRPWVRNTTSAGNFQCAGNDL